ncbi:MAG: hypothetical protein RIT14_112 [Pseudomonadota bacterium]
MFHQPIPRLHPARPLSLPRPGRTMPWKRPLDITLACLLLLLLWPLFALLWLAVRLGSPGPAFFVQTRIGKDGRAFRMWKFRSMFIDAEARLSAIRPQSDRAGLCFKARRDPRITPLGRLLRRSSLDELPQIFNVLRGDMSLVGPRPALPHEVALYPPRAMERLSCLPGITGLWQVSGRADIAFDTMVEMDIAYARQATLGTDLRLIWQTLGAVLSGRGAY